MYVNCSVDHHVASNLDGLETAGPSWEAGFNTARTWLHQCLESHSKCRRTLKTDRANPTRLLKIAQDGSNTIHLILDTSENSPCQYATVSHCWGASQVWRLTSDTRRVLTDGLSITELGQTFQDVIRVAKSFDLQYIWIDALCIFQDSKIDWEYEAPRMVDVYKNAIVNIAASVAADNQAGCFPAGPRTGVGPCYVQSDWKDYDKNNNFHMYYKRLWPAAFEDMPLMKRAWVVQELLLAPRVLHMTGKQLYWQCYDLTACESYPKGVPPNLEIQEAPRDILYDALHHVRSGTKDEYPPGVLQELWQGIVQRYASCGLTRSSDKLVALGGLAGAMQRAFNDQYCAGLWRSCIIRQLSWDTSYWPWNIKSTPRPRPYRAPSWSWASVDDHVSFSVNEDPGEASPQVHLIEVLECEATNYAGGTTGTVTRGHLKLSGWLSTLKLDIDDETQGYSTYFNGGWVRKPKLQFDCQIPSAQLHCLPLYVNRSQSSTMWIVPLLLLHPTGDVPGRFQRYGVAWITPGSLDVKKWADLKSIKNEPWLEYEAIGKDGMHTLTIV